MDRTGQMWATTKEPERLSLYVVLDTRMTGNDIWEHAIAVFTNGVYVRRLQAMEMGAKWESILTLQRIA